MNPAQRYLPRPGALLARSFREGQRSPRPHSRTLVRPHKKGRKLLKLTKVLSAPTTVWTTIVIPEWYAGERCHRVRLASYFTFLLVAVGLDHG
jgi:hypothetical protein